MPPLRARWGPNFAEIPYTKLTRPYWPRVEDPFKAA